MEEPLFYLIQSIWDSIQEAQQNNDNSSENIDAIEVKIAELRIRYKELDREMQEAALPVARLLKKQTDLLRDKSHPMPLIPIDQAAKDLEDALLAPLDDPTPVAQALTRPAPPVALTTESVPSTKKLDFDPDNLLEKLGYSSWRDGQKEVVTETLLGRDTLVIMPTGGGKSLCYQLAAMALEDLTIIVSPLIALMQDQTQRLQKHGRPAVMIASNQTEEDNQSAIQAIKDGTAQVVFAAPERFSSLAFLEALKKRKVSLVAIDEAHCVSAWGHDFRPDYLRLASVISDLGRPPIMALTATATPLIAQDILQRLSLQNPYIHRGGFDRPNLTFDVIQLQGKGSTDRKLQILTQGLAENNMLPAIVYCGTKKDTESVAEHLQKKGLSALPYHAGMRNVERANNQDAFMNGKCDVMVATNAFGMGVDKADIRSVWHYAIPTSIEGYYQEAGRAGRDGKPSHAILLALRADLGRLITFNKRATADVEAVAKVHAKLLADASGTQTSWFSGLNSPPKKAGEFTVQMPDDDSERLALAIAERIDLINLKPAGGGYYTGQVLSKTFTPQHRQAAREALDYAKNVRWEAYRSMEQFSAEKTLCRRKQILRHFADNTQGTLSVRCCDVCESPHWFTNVEKQITAAPIITKKRTAAPGQALKGELLEDLKVWRSQTAGRAPAYTICKNETLDFLARIQPKTEEELAEIKGIGPAFLRKYGQEIISLIAEHRQ